MSIQLGIKENLKQFTHQLFQVLLVGLTLGMMRTVVPALAESDFGVPKNSFFLLTSFVVAFGLIKALMNFMAGRLSESLGRKNVLLIGWLTALPIPFMVWYAPTWYWIVLATVLLGVNQGLAWSMTQTAKLDITHIYERGLTLGLNEFSGYAGVAIAGFITAWMATWLGARWAILLFGLGVTIVGFITAKIWLIESLPWLKINRSSTLPEPLRKDDIPRHPEGLSDSPTTYEVFTLVSWKDRRMFAICQAGLVEKFVDALFWVFVPLYLLKEGLSLAEIGAIVGLYGITWGFAQLFTGHLSDRIGRQLPNVLGMLICGVGVLLMVSLEGQFWWAVSASISGLGMAMLYPNLSASMADISRPSWRGSAIGVYRFWRDLGYSIGALGLGLVAHHTGHVDGAFIFVAISMILSCLVLWIMGQETHPRLNPNS